MSARGPSAPEQRPSWEQLEDTGKACEQRENGVKGWQTGIHDSADMCRAYAHFVEDAFAEPYFIGYHHCGFIEQWDGSDRGDVATNENGLIDPFEKMQPVVESTIPLANRNAHKWHAKATV